MNPTAPTPDSFNLPPSGPGQQEADRPGIAQEAPESDPEPLEAWVSFMTYTIPPEALGRRIRPTLSMAIAPPRVDPFTPCTAFVAKFPEAARRLADLVRTTVQYHLNLDLVRRDEQNAQDLFRGWADGRGLPARWRELRHLQAWTLQDPELSQLDPMDDASWDFIERCRLISIANQVVIGAGPFADAQLFSRESPEGDDVVAMISHPLALTREDRLTLGWAARVSDLDLEIRKGASWVHPGKGFRVMMAAPGIRFDPEDECEILHVMGEALRDGGRWPTNPY